jgi:hypothetical protein
MSLPAAADTRGDMRTGSGPTCRVRTRGAAQSRCAGRHWLPRALLLTLALALCPSLPGLAASVELELWCDLDPIVQEGAGQDIGPLDRQEAIRRLLEEARSALSAMVYGFDFVYTPSDAARSVGEVFELTPHGTIPWGDQRLTVADTRLEGHRLRALIRYELTAEQQSWRQAWQTGTIPKAAGEGTGNVFLGYRERETAMVNAIKESIRNHLRPRLLNKPREVRGELLLWDLTGTYVAAGEYHTRLVTRLRLTSVLPYLLY